MGKEKQTKLEALVLHFANNVPLHLGYKKLAKMMYFADFTAYELKEKTITGEKYKKYHYGPMPVNFYEIIEQMKKNGYIESKPQLGKYIPATIKPLKKPDYTVFSKNEVEVIESITEKYKNSTARELELQAKSEPPYKMVEFDEEIPYHLAFYRNSFGEMELNENDNTLSDNKKGY